MSHFHILILPPPPFPQCPHGPLETIPVHHQFLWQRRNLEMLLLSSYHTDTAPTTQAWGLSLFQLPWPVFVPFIHRRYVQFGLKAPLDMALDVSLSEKLIAHQKCPPVDSLWSWEGKLGGFCLAVWLMMHPVRDSMGLLLPSVTLEVLSSCSAPGQYFTPMKTSYCLVLQLPKVWRSPVFHCQEQTPPFCSLDGPSMLKADLLHHCTAHPIQTLLSRLCCTTHCERSSSKQPFNC